MISGRKPLHLAFLVFVGMMYASAETQAPTGVEIRFNKELSSQGETEFGQLLCQARGKNVTIDSLTITKLVIGASSVVMALTKSKPEEKLHLDIMRGNGSLGQDLATVRMELLVEEAYNFYFTCEVTYTTGSGQREEAFSMTGPGKPPKLQSQPEPDNESPVNVKLSKPTPYKTSNPLLSELWFLGEKIAKVEGKFETLSDRLDRRLSQNIDAVQSRAGTLENSVLERVSSVETDFSSRVSRLEDRVSSFLLSESPDTSSDVAQSLADMERRLEDMRAELDQMNVSNIAPSGYQQKVDLPVACEPGMGDDVTKHYPPYVIMHHEGLGRDILCDTHTDGGGWIIFQRRATGDVEFYRDWTAYKTGFGALTGDFWLGNDAIHALTDQHPYELRLRMRHKGQEIFAGYSSFRIEDEVNKYKIRLGTFTGPTATGDGFTYSNNMAFTTFDRDNDIHKTVNCAVNEHGAWWYKGCHGANLNGGWGVKTTKGASWNSGSGGWLFLSFTEMKIRRTTGNPGS
ncbi:hypothetical protein RRG08_058388 [Elysia crispata]|uniref:Fibrinogen C-terminal domain-containing protein n=1 Tax=Elysia crispata TaxID=231223 RepID=A0AAE1CN85_9GAST|nr:hypothetical protein RRG08_058388 [Elysia crispata]